MLTGLSVMNKSYVGAMIDELENSKTLFWFMGFVTVVLGSVTLGFYSTWTFDWPVIITIIGWMMLLKGMLIMLFPATWVPLYKKFHLNGMVTVSGAIAIIVGIILLYEGFLA